MRVSGLLRNTYTIDGFVIPTKAAGRAEESYNIEI